MSTISSLRDELKRKREKYLEEVSEVKPFVDSEHAVDFTTYDCPFFHVEFTERGTDIIYHFWPPGDDCVFKEGFLENLETGFKRCLPDSFRGKVFAEYTNHREATVQHMHGAGAVPKKDMHLEICVPRETVYVKVPDAMSLPLADVFLKRRVFRVIEDEFYKEP